MSSRTKLFIASMVLEISLCLLPGISYADTCHIVEPNDTLWGISKTYGVKENVIRELNNLHNDLIHPGQKLVISKDGNRGVNNRKVNNRGQIASRSGNNNLANRILSYAKTLIGVPYRSNGSTPAGFDCSGYTNFVYKQFNIKLPRTSGGQYKFGKPVSASQAKPGDLVAFKCNGRINHVGIFMGNGKFIHSSSSRGITVSRLHDSYWGPRFLGYSRVIASS